ncbi:MAG: FAD-dependent oxidoreductase [Chloroflexi bacterium]|nr:FAD-dependent oxidoreductase [Chloroflexota bacterium]
MKTYDIVVVGSGIYGITAALELHARGYQVAVIDPGPIPHPLAASTDISKAIRAEYGADEDYTIMMEEARLKWLTWNEEFQETLYTECGTTMLTRGPMLPGSYEHDSYDVCKRRGHPLERLNADEIRRRFPAWNADLYTDGYFSQRAGWAASGRVVEVLSHKAQRSGIDLYPGQTAAELLSDGDRVVGVRTREGETFQANTVLVAMGQWSWLLVPELKKVMQSNGMPVVHLKPVDPKLFAPPLFVNWAADVARTGFYGFPLHPKEGVVKIGYHGAGQRDMNPEKDDRVVNDADIRRVRAFVAETFPALVDAPIVYTRRCLYCDTFDEHFWIDRHPHRPGLVVAAGGSGHGFKFGPIFGDLIANAVEGKADWRLHKFRWRSPEESVGIKEASRFHEA